MDLTIILDANAALPLHQQLYEELRRAILSGGLSPRQRVPSTRSLSKSLGISRTTVTQSYEQLRSEGYIQTVIGSGTYVCAQLPDDLLRSIPTEPAQEVICPPLKLSQYGAKLAEAERSLMSEPIAPINFRYGRPAFEQFPIKLWRKLLTRHCQIDTTWLDYSTDLLGYKPLRAEIAHYLSRARAVQCEPGQVMITNGTQQALYLVMRLLIDPGDAVALENPGYLSARRIFLSQGAKLLPIAVDESGFVVKDLDNYASEPIKLVYVTPSHQFPTGAILSLPRRLELLVWAQQTGALILEDDYDSEYRYGDRPIPALQGLDKSQSVLYIGTFSKVLFPSLRIGYLVLPPHLVSLFTQAKWLSDRQLPLLEQRVLANFIAEGYLERHIRKMRSHYDLCRQTLVQALKAHFGEQVTILGEKAGIHLMVRFQIDLSDAEIVDRAAQVGVGIMSAQAHYLDAQPNGEFIFGYGELSPEQLQEGISRVAQVLRK